MALPTAMNIKLAVTALIRFFKEDISFGKRPAGKGSEFLGIRWESGGVDTIKIHCTHL